VTFPIKLVRYIKPPGCDGVARLHNRAFSRLRHKLPLGQLPRNPRRPSMYVGRFAAQNSAINAVRFPSLDLSPNSPFGRISLDAKVTEALSEIPPPFP